MRQLVAPSAARHAAWSAAHREWGPGLHEDGFGLGPEDDVESAAGFAAWVDRVRSLPRARAWWVLDRDEVLGGVVLRTTTTETALALGHVGYGVRPSARGRGVATWALREVTLRARVIGLDRLLVVCRDGNVGSTTVIERNGGVLEAVVDQGRGAERRYWIDLESL